MNLNLSEFRLPRGFGVRLIAVILAIVGLGFFYWTSQTKVPEIETQISLKNSEIQTLEQTARNLETLYKNMDFYLEETDRLKIETDDENNEGLFGFRKQNEKQNRYIHRS